VSKTSLDEPVSCRYLRAALAATAVEAAPADPLLPFHQALIAFETCKSQLALVAEPRRYRHVDSSDLAHAPLLLSPRAWPRVYNYAVQHGSKDAGTRGPCRTRLLIYCTGDNSVQWLELKTAMYTLVLALQLATAEQCPLGATELLMELAEIFDTDDAQQFVEQGLKLLCRLNELGLIEGAAEGLQSVREAQAHKQ
jgi:hypothetical protein